MTVPQQRLADEALAWRMRAKTAQSSFEESINNRVPLVEGNPTMFERQIPPPTSDPVAGVYSGYSGLLTNSQDDTQAWWAGTQVARTYGIVDVTAWVNRLLIEPAGGPLSLVGGPVLLDQDPVDPLGAATKRYVDSVAGTGSGSGIPEAPADSVAYGRENYSWVPVL